MLPPAHGSAVDLCETERCAVRVIAGRARTTARSADTTACHSWREEKGTPPRAAFDICSERSEGPFSRTILSLASLREATAGFKTECSSSSSNQGGRGAEFKYGQA